MSTNGPFRRIAWPGGWCLVDKQLEAGIRERGLLSPSAAARLPQQPAEEGGRTAVSVVSLPGVPLRIHLRPVQHGGLLAGLWRGRILGMARPEAELAALQLLRERGAPVPAPALVSGERAGCLWKAVVGTVYQEGTQDGAQLLERGLDAERLIAAARALGAALRCLHDAGCRHADLQIRNLLFRETAGGFEVIVVDLDRARVSRALRPARRMTELMRLLRSLRKRGLLERVGPRGCAACLGSYTNGDRRLRRAMLAHLPWLRAQTALHALGYRF